MRYILHIAHFFARLFSLGAISRFRVEAQVGGGGFADVEVRRAAETGGGDAGVKILVRKKFFDRSRERLFVFLREQQPRPAKNRLRTSMQNTLQRKEAKFTAALRFGNPLKNDVRRRFRGRSRRIDVFFFKFPGDLRALFVI